jgi:hypothetical protein
LALESWRRRTRGLRASIVHWLWTNYHAYRQARLREAFDAAQDSDAAFTASLRWLDEYGRLELLESLEYCIRRTENVGERERLKRSRDLLLPKL